ncbi:MAG TPA: hypothetical protein PL110_21640 [Candidatus Eremiobacteraeota bacterium]|nr:hypothetical protein [Candidatus Eremiobacteraeota bacterium]
MILSYVSARNIQITPSPGVSPTAYGTNEISTKEEFLTLYLIISGSILFICIILFLVFRIKAKLKTLNNHKKPIMELASRNAGVILPEDPKKE